MLEGKRGRKRTFSNTSSNLGQSITQSEDSLLGQTTRPPRDPYPQILAPIKHNTIVGLHEEILNTARNIRKQTNRIPQEICAAENAVDLRAESLGIVECESFLQDGERESDVFDDEGVESDWGVVDVSKSHGESVDEEVERILRAQSA